MRSGDVTTNDGVKLHYVEAGSGPDLLLVNGWTLTAELWRHEIGEFSRTHHVVAYDHRGHGSHQSILENPSAVNGAIRAFLGSTA